ncbi:hypothetical protein [Bradyrhizobium sp. LMTR 3]|uniref:hypothetical protein n=1 Tax=Bradyrhizobium sp. LMTR 3 TaxID=189873 RepID=UPI00081060A1|nr:hypothetical protein [Bradyrhizobium sp. LMTR 3]OCK59892.1 hypothetical protein LMTR3_19960 [Bradyrhizobium sp. LMTR 3]
MSRTLSVAERAAALEGDAKALCLSTASKTDSVRRPSTACGATTACLSDAVEGDFTPGIYEAVYDAKLMLRIDLTTSISVEFTDGMMHFKRRRDPRHLRLVAHAAAADEERRFAEGQVDAA